jgi:hypothetical protein
MKIMFGKGNESSLTRNEMVGLINLMAKLSNSIKWYYEWIEYEKTVNSYKDIANYSSLIFGTLGILLALGSISVSHLNSWEDNKDNDQPDEPKPRRSRIKKKID